jgi:hypothetical protein
MKAEICLIILMFALPLINHAQTVIEMTHPADANLVLLQVDNPKDADIVIYRTNDKVECEEWDCMWKFKTWGFCNFSVYLTKNANDSLLNDEEMGINYNFMGKIYFTDDKSLRGYKTPGFQLEGVFRKTKTNNSEESRISKEKARDKSNEDDQE